MEGTIEHPVEKEILMVDLWQFDGYDETVCSDL